MDINPKMISINSDYFKVNDQELNKRYWAYIIYNMHHIGLISGVVFADIDNLKHPYPLNWDDCMITPLGIEYLTDNSILSKARDFLKDAKSIVPFI